MQVESCESAVTFHREVTALAVAYESQLLEVACCQGRTQHCTGGSQALNVRQPDPAHHARLQQRPAVCQQLPAQHQDLVSESYQQLA